MNQTRSVTVVTAATVSQRFKLATPLLQLAPLMSRLLPLRVTDLHSGACGGVMKCVMTLCSVLSLGCSYFCKSDLILSELWLFNATA